MCKSKLVVIVLAMVTLAGVNQNMLYAKDTKWGEEKMAVQNTELIPQVVPLILNESEKVVLDDRIIELSTITKDNRKYVPLRELSEKLGYKVSFIKDTKEIVVIKDRGKTQQQTVKLKVGDKEAVIGEEKRSSDVAPFILEETSTTYVPLRFISELFGCDVDASGNYIVIDSKSGVDQKVREALYDSLVLDELVYDYIGLFNRFKEVGKDISHHENLEQVSNEQDEYAIVTQMHLDIRNLNNNLEHVVFRTQDFNIDAMKKMMRDSLKIMENYCIETLDNKDWSNFQGDQYISDLVDLHVVYLTIESEHKMLSELLNIRGVDEDSKLQKE